MRVEVVNNYSNSTNFVLVRNRKVMEDLSSITRVVFTINSVAYDSAVLTPGYIYWDGGTLLYQKRITTEYVGALFGLFGIPVGTYSGCRMEVYFSGYVDAFLVLDNATFIVRT